MELSTAEGEAHHLLTESLPMYVVKCFTAAGFDTIDVISKMDVSTDPGNSIEQIEQYNISNEYPDYFASKSKKFPPGHRLKEYSSLLTEESFSWQTATQWTEK